MQYLQTKLSSFFRRSGGEDDNDSECPNEDCIYDHGNPTKKYKTQMLWTQVVQVEQPMPD